MKCSNPRLTHEYGRGWVLCFDVDSESTGLAKLAVDKHKDGYVDLTVDKWSDKRSIQANAYFHVLVNEIAKATKSSIYGMGLNFQNCHNIIYCGISDSFESFYQSVRRCWRYGQEHEVNAHIIISEKELNVLDNIKRKEAQMNEMQSKMISLMHDVTMSQLHHTTRITTEYNPKERMGIPSWIA